VATNAEITGDIWEEADPNFNNYTYRYNVSHMHVAMKGKLFMESWKIAEPYVSVSIGGGVNRSTNILALPLKLNKKSQPLRLPITPPAP
jgi:hypothetical protein